MDHLAEIRTRPIVRADYCLDIFHHLEFLFYQVSRNLRLFVTVTRSLFTFIAWRTKQTHFSKRWSMQETKMVDSVQNTSQADRRLNSLRLNQVPLVCEVTLRYVCCEPRSRIELWCPCPVRWRSLAARRTSFLFHLSLSQKYFSQLLKQCVWTSWERRSDPRIQTPHYMNIT